MKLLILGGTRFFGRHLAALALDRGWHVALFNRGITNPGLFPQAEHIKGDRLGDASALEGKAFDAVVDVACYHPRALELLLSTNHYTFVSSISAYANLSKPGASEDDPTSDDPDPMPNEYDPELYGPLKATSERIVKARYERSLIIRPGLIVGPHDQSDRFTYWPARAARGGEILAPGDPDRLVQLIDVRDLAEWMLDMIAASKTGTYNATSKAIPMHDVLKACITAAGTEPIIRWIDDETLKKNGVEEWVEMPLWIADQAFAGMMQADVAKAFEAGLRTRPLVETARDTLAWDRTRGDEPWHAGLAPEKEREILARERDHESPA